VTAGIPGAGPQNQGIGKQAEKVRVEMSGGHTGGCRTGGVNLHISRKDIKAVVILRPVKNQQQRSGRVVGSRTAPWAKSKVEQSVDAVQPGNISDSRRHFRGSHIGVAPGTGGSSVEVGRILAIRMTWQNLQGRARKVSTAKHGENCSICRSSGQVPLSAEGEVFMRLTNQRSTTINDVSKDGYYQFVSSSSRNFDR
jgi:hypothetical protein